MDPNLKSPGPTRQWQQGRKILALALCTLVAAACHSDQRGDPTAHRPASDTDGAQPVILMAMDGLDWNVALPLMRAGRLPHLEALARSGQAGRLETLRPTVSPAIWTTVATGVAPKTHGILGFVKRVRNAMALYTSADRRVKTLWDIASDAGLRSLVVGWWATFPVEPTNGVVVAQVNTLPTERREKGQTLKGGPSVGTPGQVWPPERQAEILKTVHEVETEIPGLAHRLSEGADFSGDATVERFWRESLWSLRADTSYARIAIKQLNEATSPSEVPQLVAVYTGLTDVIAHRFWRWAYPHEFKHPPTPEASRAYGSLVNRAYEYADAALGQLRAAAPKDATIIVLSDHGMEAHRVDNVFDADAPSGQVSAAHHRAPPGVLLLSGPNILPLPFNEDAQERSDLPLLGSVADIAPTVLALMDLPVGDDMSGEVLESLFTPEFRRDREIKTIATHTPEGWAAARTFAGTELPGSEERVEQLRALGYLDD